MKPRILSTARLSFPLASAIAALLAAPAAYANTRNWDGDTSVTWATAGNWDTLPTSDLTTDIANFNLAVYGGNPVFAPTSGTRIISGITIGAANGAMTLTTGATPGLSIGGNGLTIASGAGALTLPAASVVTIGATQSWANDDNDAATFGAIALGVNTLNLTAGDFIFIGANTGTAGTINLNAGNLRATAAAAFGPSGNTLKFGGGNLELRQAAGVTAGTTFTGKIDMTTAGTTVTVSRTDNPSVVTTHLISGATTLGGGQTMVMSSGANIAADTAYGLTLSGAKTLTGDSTYTINGNGSGAGTLSLITGTINTGGGTRTLTFNNGTGTGANKAVISGAFTGTAGTLVLAGSAPVTVTLTTSANALQINSTTSGVYTLGNSSFTGGLTLTSGRILIPGTGNATLGPFGNGGTFTINGGIIDSSGGAKTVSHVNPITIGGDFAYSTSAGAAADDVTLPGAITMAADRTVTLNGLGALTLSGKLTNTSDSVRTLTVNNGAGTDAGSILTIGSYDLTGPGSTAARNNIINGSGRVTISGVIADGVSSGSGLTYSGTGTLTLRGSNTYSGTTTISEGTLQAGAAAGGQAFGNGSAVTLADTAGATLNLNNFSQTIGSLAGGGTTGGNVTLGANATLTTGGNNTSTSYAGIISGTGTSGLTKTGNGTLTLNGTNTYDGATAVNLGTLFINGDQTSANGAITVASTATLGGTGTLGGATTIQSGGFYSPGNSSGTLNHAAGLTLAAGSIFNWENTTTNTLGSGGTDWDLTNITAGVRTLDPTATTGSQLRLQFSNAGTDFTDTFWNSAHTWDFITGGSGANAFDATNISIWINGVQQGSNNTITGQGTFTTIVSGGNLQLVWEAALPVIPTAYWAGATNGDWGTLNNWRDAASGPGAVISSAPTVGTDVHFSTTDPVPGNLGTVNLGANFKVKTLTFDASSGAVTIGGTNTLTITPSVATDGVVVDITAGDNTLATKVALGANQTWTVGAARNLTASEVVSGAFNLTKAGTGTLTLTASNTYTGNTTVSAGTLEIGGAGQLGGGTYENFIDIAASATFKFNSSANQTISTAVGVIRGSGTFIKDGAGTLTLFDGGEAPSIFSGQITINQGTLSLKGQDTFYNKAGTYSIASGAVLELETLSNAFPAPGTTTITGTGTMIIDPAVALRSFADTDFLTFAMGSGGLIDVKAGKTFWNGDKFTDFDVNTITWTSNQARLNLDGILDVRSGNDVFVDALTGAGSVTKTSSLTNAAVTLTVGVANGSGTFTGTIGNDGGVDVVNFTKTGSGTQTLSGANTYTGVTTVSAGTLRVNSPGSLAAASAVAVNGGTLGGTGTIGGTVTVAAAGNLAPGASAGTLTVGALDISAQAGGAGTLNYELDALAGTNDKIVVTGTLTIGSGALGMNDFVFTNLGGLQAGTYKLITSAGITGGNTLDATNLTGTIGAFNAALQINVNDIELVVTSATTPYDTWASSKGLTAGNKAKNLDPDNDGSNNLAEFALDGNPLSGANDGKVVGKVATVGGNQVMTLTLPVRNGAIFSPDSGDQLSALIDGVHYRIEGDVNLSTFADTITEVTGGDATAIQVGLPGLSDINADTFADWTYRTFRHSGTVPATPKAFLRAKVSETP